MLDIVNSLELLGLAFDVFCVYVLNRFYKNRIKDAELIANAQSFEVNKELSSALAAVDDKALPYACVCGSTAAVGKPLTSQYTDTVGVIQHQLMVEHKSKKTQGGFWTDVKNVIKDHFNTRPFLLVSNHPDADSQQLSVEVNDVLSADYLRDSLTVIHDVYQPSNSNLLARGVDRFLFGETTKGYQETESMLAVGVPLLGIGKLMLLSENRIVLCPPDDGRPYILTPSSKTELVKRLKSQAWSLNVARWVFGIVGASVVAYVVFRTVRRCKSRWESRRLLNELRERRQATAGPPTTTEDPQRLCVVCLSQPREVVLLDCGHICLCGDCADVLPVPKRCPVCRCSIARIIPTYLS